MNFNDLRDNVKTLLSMQGVPYIADQRKELNALNAFMMDGHTPEYVCELLGMLIKIKKHPDYAKDKFWIGAGINIAGAHSYQVQIRTVYSNLFPEMEKVKIEPASPNEKPDPKTVWKAFLDWCSKEMSDRTYLSFTVLNVCFEENEIWTEDEINPFQFNVLQKWFLENAPHLLFRKGAKP